MKCCRKNNTIVCIHTLDNFIIYGFSLLKADLNNEIYIIYNGMMSLQLAMSSTKQKSSMSWPVHLLLVLN